MPRKVAVKRSKDARRIAEPKVAPQPRFRLEVVGEKVMHIKVGCKEGYAMDDAVANFEKVAAEHAPDSPEYKEALEQKVAAQAIFTKHRMLK